MPRRDMVRLALGHPGPPHRDTGTRHRGTWLRDSRSRDTQGREARHSRGTWAPGTGSAALPGTMGSGYASAPPASPGFTPAPGFTPPGVPGTPGPGWFADPQ